MATINQVLAAQAAVTKAREALRNKEARRNQLLESCQDLPIPKHWDSCNEVFKIINAVPSRIRVYSDKSITVESLTF
jgi:hypothetical protein